jgi:hypothetical protein
MRTKLHCNNSTCEEFITLYDKFLTRRVYTILTLVKLDPSTSVENHRFSYIMLFASQKR